MRSHSLQSHRSPALHDRGELSCSLYISQYGIIYRPITDFQHCCVAGAVVEAAQPGLGELGQRVPQNLEPLAADVEEDGCVGLAVPGRGTQPGRGGKQRIHQLQINFRIALAAAGNNGLEWMRMDNFPDLV